MRLFTYFMILSIFLMTAIPASAGKTETNIYGRAHLSVESLGDGDDSSIYVSSNNSRIGFKGYSRLDHGLKLVWKIESRVIFDESGDFLASRDTYAGIKGGFGFIYFGRADTPFKRLLAKTDLFRNRIGDARNLAGQGGAGFDLRMNNVIGYSTPEFEGINGSLMVSTEDGVEETSLFSASVIYNNHGFMAGAAWEQHGRWMTMTEDSLASDESESGFRFALGYGKDEFNLAGSLEILSDIGGTADISRKTWGIAGWLKPSDDFKFRSQFLMTSGVVVDDTLIDETGAKIFSAAIDYLLSNKTTMYAAYSTALNEDDADYLCTGGGHGDKVYPEAGDNPFGFSIGLIHLF